MRNTLLWATILIISITLLSYVGYSPLSYGPTNSDGPTSSPSNTETALFDKFVEVPLATNLIRKELNPREHYSIDVHYPSIHLVSNQNLAMKTNTVIATFVEDIIQKFERNVLEMNQEDFKIITTSDLTMRWTPELLSPKIISIRFDISEYVAGAAHPNSEVKILNYDIEQHAFISTTEFFASSTEGLSFLANFSLSTLRDASRSAANNTDSELLTNGTRPTPDNYANVAINKAGLKIFFNPYQIAAYARGSQELQVPLSELQEYLAPDILEAIRLGNTNFREAIPETILETN